MDTPPPDGQAPQARQPSHYVDAPVPDALTKRRQEYAEYLRAPHWQNFRAEAIRAANGRCQYRFAGLCCRRDRLLQVHHLHYRTLGCETLADVQVVCVRHHLLLEASKKGLTSLLADVACYRCGRFLGSPIDAEGVLSSFFEENSFDEGYSRATQAPRLDALFEFVRDTVDDHLCAGCEARA